MPCASIHLFLAQHTLSEWANAPASSPFDAHRPEHREAFLHGSLAPDMGFIPGTHRFISEVAHYVRTGDLARALLREASTEREVAFAWGWVSHLLGDVLLHPRVGHACGERVTGDRSVRLNASEDLPTHVGMEVGLDLIFLRRHPETPSPPRRPGFDPVGITYLSRAMEKTYEIPWDGETLLGSHRRAVGLTARWPLLLTILEWGRPVSHRAAGLRRATGRVVAGVGERLASGGSAARGFFQPIRPPEWLVAEAEEAGEEVTQRMSAMVRDGLEGLGNHNLETGALEGSDVPHPDGERSRARWEALRSGRVEEAG